jgi:hypothetical protein
VASDNETQAARRATGTDFNETLHHAERLLRDVDGARTRIHLIRLIGLGVVVITGLVAIPSAAWSDGLWPAAAATWSVASVLSVVVLASSSTKPLHRQLRRDELAMVDLVDGLRELLPLLADEEKWNSTLILLAQTRLERFPIGVEHAAAPQQRGH